MSFRDSDKMRAIRELLADMKDVDSKTIESYFRIQWIFMEMHIRCDEWLLQFGMNRARYIPLAILYSHKEKMMKTSELADHVGVSRATMTGLVDGLERAGFVERDTNAEDRRTIYLKLTDKGTKLVRKVAPAYFRMVAEIYGPVSKEEFAILDSLCTRIEKAPRAKAARKRAI